MTNTPYGLNVNGASNDCDEEPFSFSNRYGYQVGDAEPRWCATSHDRGDAIRNAKREAGKVREELRKLGAPSIVDAWIQLRKRTVTIEFGEPEGNRRMTGPEIVTALIRIRHQRGMLQRDVAARVGVCKSAIGHLEARKRQPELATILRYTEAVGATITVVAR